MNPENRYLLQTLIKNPDAVIVEVEFDDGTQKFLPFVCRKIPLKDSDSKMLRNLAQFILGVSHIDPDPADYVNQMELEFPECFTCPALPVNLSSQLPKGKKPVAFTSNVWSRDALKYPVARASISRAPFVISQN